MKNLKTLSLLALGALACSSAFARADAPAPIKAYYAKEDSLMLKGNFEGLKKLQLDNSTPDYVSISKPDKSGKVRKKTRTEDVAQIDQFSKIIDSVTQSVSHIDSVTIGKNTATVVVTSTGELSTKKAAFGDGKAHIMSNTSKSQDTWVKVGGSWKMKISKELTDNLKIDGKPAPGG